MSSQHEAVPSPSAQPSSDSPPSQSEMEGSNASAAETPLPISDQPQRFFGTAGSDPLANRDSLVASSRASTADPPLPITDQHMRFFGFAGSDPLPNRDSLMTGSSTPFAVPPNDSAQNLQPQGQATYQEDSSNPSATQALFPDDSGAEKQDPLTKLKGAKFGIFGSKKRRWLFIAIAIAAVIIIAVAVAVPLATRKSGSNISSHSPPSGGGGGGGGGGTGTGGGPPTNPNTTTPIVTTGGDGSVITMEDGTNFTYRNPFGGFWVDNPDDPFNNGAQAQSWVPALNQTWDWNKNRAFGVNLGGWLVLEPFITPAYFEKYPGTLDEWSLSQAVANDPTSGGLQAFIENHYKTFITEQDFAQIAGAGLSWVRIPFPFWAVESRNGEPFVGGVSWQYFLKAIKWARKYGIRINLDLHTLPGSQNGYNHGGKQGSLGFLNGVMGIANAQRAVEYIRIITEFISQPEYSNIVPIFGIVNEPTTAIDVLSHFYLESHNMIRNIAGYGAGNGPFISIHDAFTGPENWIGYMSGADRLIIDSHPYFCFGPPDSSPFAQQVNKPCSWGAGFNHSMMNFGVTTAGEWSLGFNDCGKWINGVGSGSRWEGTFGSDTAAVGNCSDWTNWAAYTTSTKTDFHNFALSSMDALPNWFFWTWKVGNSSLTGKVEAPMWSYSLGLEHGWIPSDPRASLGTCRAAGDNNPITASLQPTATGGSGAGTIAPTFVSSFSAWPPQSLAAIPDATFLPTYTATQAIPTLAAPTYTARNGTKIVGGTGWFNVNDHAQAPVNISGCTYPDPWNAVNLPVPTTSFCAPGASRRAPSPEQTAAPAR